ncbi:MAG: hypothetical protein GY751_02070 [Bacteroidetes bacterium]|nr:hypothetical protein [Bacteroidota bacterium]
METLITKKYAPKMSGKVLTDGSKLIMEACALSGADVFVGYPITPSNWFYAYAKQRMPLFLAAPDEISVLQWMAGFSAVGKFPVTATSFPGFALMIESLNMAYMMELPMLIILTQRLGPSTGSATTGAQGDLMALKGCISGGFPLPVFSPSNFEDCWNLTHAAIQTAIRLSTPVVLLSSKEMVMTQKSFDLATLSEIEKIKRTSSQIKMPFKTYYTPETLVPQYIPLGNETLQVRRNSSTHDDEGLIRKGTPESMGNTRRLKEKLEKRIDEYTFFELFEEEGADELIISYGISANAARDALPMIRSKGKKVSLLIVKTLLPFPSSIFEILGKYKNLTFVEENLPGLLREMLFGLVPNENIRTVTKFGGMIHPSEILNTITV